ncbi:ROK family transcriptional regulator [Streptomyces sp. A7024]|uniref:ROK family transcriptional regulator n=2 Tax=Streptomyces coryli TaxID=1128680 RepID=A0A6G4U6R4_9ACTN|nr:ROK family transcriptional regulator [Streptomyces coryli]NGN67929.1 ROK family transcriptional regulator [Streptomyces coryli]
MRQRNLSLVLHTLAAEGPLSRAAVAARIGVTRAGVSALVEELLRLDLITELGPGRPGTVGRPGSALALNENGPCGIGAEVGVDHLSVCAVDLRGKVVARIAVDAANRGRAPEPLLAELGRLVTAVAAEAESTGLRPAGLTVAVPGLVARGTDTVVRAPNLGWKGVEIPALLDPALTARLPVTVDNEANLGALAELWLAPTPVASDFIHVSAEIGIGAALVVDGALLRGAHGFAGELGHVPVRPEGPDCGCGGRGCLEQYAGEEAVLRASGLAPEEEAGRHPGPGARIALLAERAAAGDARVRTALEEAGTALGIALAGAVNMLDPGAVVLGGALAGLAPWMLPALEAELGGRVADPARTVRTEVSAIGADGPLLGAAHSVVHTVLDAPASYASPLE